MKKKLLVPIVIFVFGLCITGCSSDLDDTYSEDVERISDDVDGVNTSVKEKLLCDALTEIIENVNGEYSNGGYILFSSENNEVLVLSEDEYIFATGIGEVFECLNSNTKNTYHETINKAPKPNQGWKFAGTCTTKWGAIKLGKEIAEKIGEKQNFEIHTEYKDGKYYIWYRLI
ncbi:hypothetical protein [Prevotella sp. OH937_COT-195]|uniref:hypothetical protein n=1 Tax=Prevotella sp. OH937_COT-195 TaxID=2491051 RepID=UPI000F6502A0|nr:hypothetical protein [Prevotella sp. OH937_COT-195]RRC97664.1 hypothetical protein EII32_10240 [Prevotella sp. OH937_COT-195]